MTIPSPPPSYFRARILLSNPRARIERDGEGRRTAKLRRIVNIILLYFVPISSPSPYYSIYFSTKRTRNPPFFLFPDPKDPIEREIEPKTIASRK